MIERCLVKRIAQALRLLPGLEEIELSRNDAFEVQPSNGLLIVIIKYCGYEAKYHWHWPHFWFKDEKAWELLNRPYAKIKGFTLFEGNKQAKRSAFLMRLHFKLIHLVCVLTMQEIHKFDLLNQIIVNGNNSFDQARALR